MTKSVLMNPPFSTEWVPKEDGRFKGFALAPKKKADYAFLLHGYDQLSMNGKMAIILPHGVLFRGNAESKIRQKLLEMGAISTIIGLPEKLFSGTGIPICILVLEKRSAKDVLFIDAGKEFEKAKNHNLLKKEHIQKILTVYHERKEVERFSHLASMEEIKENDFNLNIPRYVDMFEPEEIIDLGETVEELFKVDAEIKKSENELADMMKDLVADSKEDQAAIHNLIKKWS